MGVVQYVQNLQIIMSKTYPTPPPYQFFRVCKLGVCCISSDDCLKLWLPRMGDLYDFDLGVKQVDVFTENQNAEPQ